MLALDLRARQGVFFIANKVGRIRVEIFPPVAEPFIECGRLEIRGLHGSILTVKAFHLYGKGFFVVRLVLIIKILVPVILIFQ